MLEGVELVEFASRTGYARSSGVGSDAAAEAAVEAARTIKVRHSVPSLGGRSRLGGLASFQALKPTGLVDRSRARLADYERARDSEDMTMLIFERAIENRCDYIDRQRDEKLLMPRPDLADYTLELAHHALHPSPLRKAI